MQFHEFVQLLEARGLKPRQLANGQWIALCPAHDDTRPSLSIAEGEKGILLHCFAGCTVDAVCYELGISVSDLFYADGDPLIALAAAKKLPPDFLRQLGWKAINETVAIPFQNPAGEIFWQYRHGLERRYSWQRGAKATELVYGLDQIPDDAQEVWICESAVDAATLQHLGIHATAVAGKGNTKAVKGFADRLASIPTIIVWQEPDAETFAQDIATALKRPVLCVQPEDGQPKDANRLWLACNADKEKFLTELKRLRANAQTVEPQTEPEQQDRDQHNIEPIPTPKVCIFCDLSDNKLLEIATPVLSADDPLNFAVELIEQATGIVAERQNLKLLLLVTATRYLPQPCHAYIVAPTGAGKSALVNAIAQTLPPCSLQRLVGASALSLMAHRLKEGTVVEWKEAPHHWNEQTLSAAILRAVLWQQPNESGDYLTLEYTNRKGFKRVRWTLPRRLCFLMTSTELPRDNQLQTRLLVIELTETPERRTAILSAIAQKWETPVHPSVTLAPIQAFHDWLARQRFKVVIPFASIIAEWLTNQQPTTRDYRDLDNLLKLIAASAIWHWQHRHKETLPDGTLILYAEVADYEIVYNLVQQSWQVVREIVTEAQRRVYETLATWNAPLPPTREDLAGQLKISREAVRKHLKALCQIGVIEETDGRPKRYRIANELPQPQPVLPDPQNLNATSATKCNFGQVAKIFPENIGTSDHLQLLQPDQCPNPQTNPNATSATKCNLPQVAQFSPENIGTSNYLQLLQDPQDLREQPQGSDDVVEPVDEDIGTKVGLQKLQNTETPENIGETFATSGKLHSVAKVANENPTDHSPKFPTNLSHLKLEVKVVCPNYHNWRRIPPDVAFLTDPVCDNCGHKMQITPEDEPEPITTKSPEISEVSDSASASSSECKLIDTLNWIGQEFDTSQNTDIIPAVEAIETGERIPVSDISPPDFPSTLHQLLLFEDLMREGGGMG